MKQREWIGIADMMSGLMMVFLFISVAYMIEIRREQQTVRDIAHTYKQTRLALNQALKREFRQDIRDWKAEIRPDNTIVFYAPEVLFKTGSSEITSRFQETLNNFFPRYLKVLRGFINDIEEIRIEGHTSSDWEGADDTQTRYLNNMNLSQQRASSVLKYCYGRTVPAYRSWFIQSVHAVGMAYSRPGRNDHGIVDPAQSRRVEFRALTRAHERIENILVKLN